MTTTTSTPKITLFYSYADKDKSWCDALEICFNRPRDNVTIENLHRGYMAGGVALKDIEKYIDQADIILLLLSPDFLNLQGHYNSPEVQYIRQRFFDKTAATFQHSSNQINQANKAPHIVPVLVRPCNWDGTPFADLQTLPGGGQSLTEYRSRDSALYSVQFEVEKLFNLPPDDIQSDQRTYQPIKSKMPEPNPFFTGRGDLLHELHERFTRQKTTPLTHKQVIYGLGGIGKTQLAIRYTHRYGIDYKHVFWVHAGTRDKLIQEYVEIAHNLALSERDEKNQLRVVEAVMNWLETNTDWLLVLDNADDLKMVQEFIPAQIGGHLLLTTRSQTVGEIAEPIEIGSMPLEEGMLFLLRRTKKVTTGGAISEATAEERRYAEDIVKELGGLPLALDQAGAYIEDAKEGLEGYLQLYRELGVGIFHEGSGLRRSHQRSVTATFLLTFTKVERTNPTAANILRLCAFLAPDAIPEKLIIECLPALIVETSVPQQKRQAFKVPFFRQARDPSKPPTQGELRSLLNAASVALLKYSLIHRDDRTKTVAIHHLVQAVLRESIPEDMRYQWAERAVRVVAAAFPAVEIHKINVQSWPECQELLPHVSMAALLMKKYQFSFPDASRLLNDAASYLTERGQYREAEPLYLQALFMRKATGGVLYAQSLHNLARVYERLAVYDKAEQNLLDALDIRVQELGEDHLDVALTLYSLASLYKIRGKTEKAERFYERAFKISQRSADPEQFYLSQDFSNQIAFYRTQKNYKKTEELYKEALEKIEQIRGKEHPHTAKILYDWGEFYKERNRLSEAAALLQRARDIREKMLGVKNAETASSLQSIAELYVLQGKAEDAENLYKKALNIRQDVLGADNPETAATLYSLARLYRVQDKIKEAERLYKQALMIRRKKFGLSHPATLQSLNELADFYKSQHRPVEAERLYKRGLASGYARLMPNDPVVLQNLRELVELYTLLDKHEEIERLYEEAFSHCADRLGVNHPFTEQCMQDLLKLYNGRRNNEKIVFLYQHAFDLRARKLRGNDQTSLQKFKQNLEDLADIYDQLKRPKEKMYLYMKGQEICGQVLGVGDPLERYCYNELMKIGEDQDQSKEVEDFYHKRFKKGQLELVSLAKTGEVSDVVYGYQQTKRDLRKFYENQRRFKEAERIQTEGLMDSYRRLGIDHPASVQSRHELVQFYEDHDKLKEAEFVYLVAIEYCKTHFGPQSPLLLECRNELVCFYLRHTRYEAVKPHIEEMRQFIEPMLDEQPIPGPYLLAIIHTLANIACFYQRRFKRKSKTADAWFKQALQLSESSLGKDHQETIDIRQRYISCLEEMGRYVEAAALKIDAIPMEKDKKKQNEQDI